MKATPAMISAVRPEHSRPRLPINATVGRGGRGTAVRPATTLDPTGPSAATSGSKSGTGFRALAEVLIRLGWLGPPEQAQLGSKF